MSFQIFEWPGQFRVTVPAMLDMWAICSQLGDIPAGVLLDGRPTFCLADRKSYRWNAGSSAWIPELTLVEGTSTWHKMTLADYDALANKVAGDVYYITDAGQREARLHLTTSEFIRFNYKGTGPFQYLAMTAVDFAAVTTFPVFPALVKVDQGDGTYKVYLVSDATTSLEIGSGTQTEHTHYEAIDEGTAISYQTDTLWKHGWTYQVALPGDTYVSFTFTSANGGPLGTIPPQGVVVSWEDKVNNLNDIGFWYPGTAFVPFEDRIEWENYISLDDARALASSGEWQMGKSYFLSITSDIAYVFDVTHFLVDTATPFPVTQLDFNTTPLTFRTGRLTLNDDPAAVLFVEDPTLANLETRMTTAEGEIDQLQADVVAAQNDADTAITNAAAAHGLAGNAYSLADQANTAAGTAQTAANNAQTTANAASSTAYTALGQANGAMTQAKKVWVPFMFNAATESRVHLLAPITLDFLPQAKPTGVTFTLAYSLDGTTFTTATQTALNTWLTDAAQDGLEVVIRLTASATFTGTTMLRMTIP